jgi:hypothetical protein
MGRLRLMRTSRTMVTKILAEAGLVFMVDAQFGRPIGNPREGTPQSTSGSTRTSAKRRLGNPQKYEQMRNRHKVGDRATPEGKPEPGSVMCSRCLACFTIVV